MAKRTNLTKVLGEVIRGLRIDRKLSQEAFAEAVGVHRTYVGFIERGEKSITVETANAISLALGVNLSTLFEEVEFRRNAIDTAFKSPKIRK